MIIPVYFVVALMPEARPLIRKFGLSIDQECAALPIYQNDGGVRLVVSGIGSMAAVAATAYLHLRQGEIRDAVWMNVGIAGHRNYPIGQAVLAHKITDADSGKSWYPPIVFDPHCPTVDVVSVRRPERSYPTESAYDMEAAGFYREAARHSSAELIHSLKIISDTADAAASRKTVTPDLADRLVEARVGLIDDIVERLIALARPLLRRNEEPSVFKRMLRQWHFTVSQQHQLRRLLARRRAIKADTRISIDSLSSCGDSRSVLRELGRRLDGMPVQLNR